MMLEECVRAWLRFDNEVEPPKEDAPYDEHLAYERQKADITEAVAEALLVRKYADQHVPVHDVLNWLRETGAGDMDPRTRHLVCRGFRRRFIKHED